MRLFCGFAIPYEVRRNLELLLQHLRPISSVRWSPAENFHITTRFIGEFADENLEKVKAALIEVPKPGELKISVKGLGWLPDIHHPKIFLAGIQCDGLQEFAKNVNNQLAAIGIEAKKTPYFPHLTLARIQQPEETVPLQKTIETLPSTEFGTFTAAHHLLYRSRLTPQGSIYSVEAKFPLV